MERIRTSLEWRRSLLVAASAFVLFGCEQSPDVVVYATTLDSGSQQQEEPEPEPEPEAGMPIEPPMNDPQLCAELTRAYVKLSMVAGNDDPCSWRQDDVRAEQLLWQYILLDPPVPFVPEQDRPTICEALLQRGIRIPYTLLGDDQFKLCPGYCKALKNWLDATGPIVDGCNADGGTL